MSDGPALGDAFGLNLLDFLDNGPEAQRHIIERDDGMVDSMDPGIFFGGPEAWTEAERPVVDGVGHSVLDVGAGAGRFSLALQSRGREVVALDLSPGAIEVCRRRGVERTFTGTVFDFADGDRGRFDTFLLCGNNYGLLGSLDHAPRFLDALRRLAAPGAEIIGTSLDPMATEDPIHLAYHELNRSRGRLPGQIRLRSRWRNIATDWYDYLLLPVDLLEEIGVASGWRLVHHTSGPGPYLAVLKLE